MHSISDIPIGQNPLTVLLQVAAALREGRAVEPENYDCVTIFFSDIVGFTNISGILQPQEVCLPGSAGQPCRALWSEQTCTLQCASGRW